MEFVASIFLSIILPFLFFQPAGFILHSSILTRIFDSTQTTFWGISLGMIIGILFYLQTKQDKAKKIFAKERKVLFSALAPLGILGVLLLIGLPFVVFSLPLRTYGIILILTTALYVFLPNKQTKEKVTPTDGALIGSAYSIGSIVGVSQILPFVKGGFFTKKNPEELFWLSLPLHLVFLGIYTVYAIVQHPAISVIVLMQCIVSAGITYLSIPLSLSVMKRMQFSQFWNYLFIVGVVLLFN